MKKTAVQEGKTLEFPFVRRVFIDVLKGQKLNHPLFVSWKRFVRITSMPFEKRELRFAGVIRPE